MAVCDADYNFLLVDIGDSGRQSDGGVFSNGNIGHAINEHTLNFQSQHICLGMNQTDIPMFLLEMKPSL